ncbi:MAG TPA: efflux transporter outer membrane subunit [Candidatus Methylacidiphilales bacterium]|nr:efflux transporter outer membrane subunit [Candidatus Methylacidiphilales bacterium]
MNDRPFAWRRRILVRRDQGPAQVRSALGMGTTLTAILLASGCAVGPDYKPVQAQEVPTTWAGATGASAYAASIATSQPAQLTKWWEKFQDPKLTSLIEEALKTNLDIKLAETNLRQARASRGIVAGGLWPNLTASGGYGRGGSDSASQDTFQAGLDSVWELDIFGGVRRNVESANANIEAAKENIHDVQITLISEVALNYIQLRSFQEQIAIARENLQSQQHTADLTRQRLAVGFASALDTANADAQVSTTASEIPVLETSLRQNIYALSVLLGRPPADLLDDLSKPSPVPLTPPKIPLGLPSDLLRRRPDIREAEAQLHAATAQIGVAIADFFPKFSLTGSLNYQNNLLGTLFAGSSLAWSVGPQVTWPILQGGSVASNVRLQKALRDQAYLTYRKTVLIALQDVENSLVAFNKEWDHRQALSNAYTQNRRALDLSKQLYSQGTTDFLNVLTAERSVYASQAALAQSKQAISTDLVALYKALGGGWEDADRDVTLSR